MSDFALQSARDCVHAGYGLEHGRLGTVFAARAELGPKAELEDIRQDERLREFWPAGRPAARVLVEAAPVAGKRALDISVIAIKRAPPPQTVEQPLLVLLGHKLVERAFVSRLGEQLCDGAVEIRLYEAEALWPAVERALGVHIGVVVDLDEGFERDAKPLAVIQDRTMVVGDAPWAGVEIEAAVKGAFLRKAAKLGVGIAAADRPGAAPRAVVVFEDLQLVAGFAQLIGRDHTSKPRAQNQH